MIKNTFVYSFLVLFPLFASCKKQSLKKVEVPAVVTTDIKTDSIPSSTSIENSNVPSISQGQERKTVKVDIDKSEFEFMKIRSKVNFTSDKISQNFPATIQIRKDSIIWISVSIGLEAARGIIKQDSIFFIDRINRNFYRFDFNTLSEQFGFKLDYASIQALLLGDLLVPQNQETLLDNEGDLILLKQKDKSLYIESAINQLINKPVRVIAKEDVSGEQLTIIYNNPTLFGKNRVPLKIDVSIDNTQSNINTAKLGMDYQKVEFLPGNLSFPFSIPKGYTEKFITTP